MAVPPYFPAPEPAIPVRGARCGPRTRTARRRVHRSSRSVAIIALPPEILPPRTADRPAVGTISVGVLKTRLHAHRSDLVRDRSVVAPSAGALPAGWLLTRRHVGLLSWVRWAAVRGCAHSEGGIGLAVSRKEQALLLRLTPRLPSERSQGRSASVPSGQCRGAQRPARRRAGTPNLGSRRDNGQPRPRR